MIQNCPLQIGLGEWGYIRLPTAAEPVGASYNERDGFVLEVLHKPSGGSKEKLVAVMPAGHCQLPTDFTASDKIGTCPMVLGIMADVYVQGGRKPI